MRSRLYAGSVSLDKQVFTTAKRQGDLDSGNSSTSGTGNFPPCPPSTGSIDQVEVLHSSRGDYFNGSTSQVSLTSGTAGDFASSFVNYEWDPCIFEGPGEAFADADAILGTVVTIDQASGEEHSTTFSLLDVPSGLLSDLSDLFVPSPGSTCQL